MACPSGLSAPTETIGDLGLVDLCIRVVNWLGDEVSALWLRLALVEISLNVSWKVSVSGVVDILSWEVVVWLIEFVQLLVSIVNVVFNTIAILIVDVLSVGVLGIFPLLTVKILGLKSNQIFWTVDFSVFSPEEPLVIHSSKGVGHSDKGAQGSLFHF